jgi:hypothetical protein
MFCFVCFLVPFTELFRHTTYVVLVDIKTLLGKNEGKIIEGVKAYRERKDRDRNNGYGIMKLPLAGRSGGDDGDSSHDVSME